MVGRVVCRIRGREDEGDGNRGDLADGEGEGAAQGPYANAHGRRAVVVEKKPRRWIEETRPVPRTPQSNVQT